MSRDITWWRGQDLNLRPSGYEPDELPDCSTPRRRAFRLPIPSVDAKPVRAYNCPVQSVDGAVSVISGAGSGIGRATARSLARRGSAVVVSDLDEQRAAAVANEIEASGGRATSARCDVSSDDDVAALADTALATFGRVDIVMSNVGVIAKGLPLDIPMEAWSSIIDVNLLGTVRVVRAFLPQLLEQGSGHVVTTGSTAGLFPYAFDRLPYAATKAAVVTLTESLALYLRPRGIGVTCFCPAGVITNIVEQIREYGPPTPVQAPQVPLITAEDAGELVVQGILDDRLLVVSSAEVAEMVEQHALDPRRLPAFADRTIWKAQHDRRRTVGTRERKSSPRSSACRHRSGATTTSPTS